MFGLQIYGITNSLSASTTTNTSISRINSFVERIKENVLNSGTTNSGSATIKDTTAMKWSSSSSSLSSGGDRRSVFYAERDSVLNEKVSFIAIRVLCAILFKIIFYRHSRIGIFLTM